MSPVREYTCFTYRIKSGKSVRTTSLKTQTFPLLRDCVIRSYVTHLFATNGLYAASHNYSQSKVGGPAAMRGSQSL